MYENSQDVLTYMIDSRNIYTLPSLLPFANPASRQLITISDNAIVLVDIILFETCPALWMIKGKCC